MNRITKEDVIRELRWAASQVEGPLSTVKFRKVGRIALNTVTSRFGKWLVAMEAAGLEPAYRFGGIWFDCPICGEKFRSNNGSKSRRTCSKACTSKLMSRSRSKGRRATRQAARGRARYRVAVEECARCGHDGSESRLEVHHIDEDPYNNAPSNLEVLCSSCHRAHHAANGLYNREGVAATKLTREIVRQIRHVYARGEKTQDELAGIFGVTQTTVGHVVRRRTWKHVTPATRHEDAVDEFMKRRAA